MTKLAPVRLGPDRPGRTPVEVTPFFLGCAPLGGLYQAVSDEQAAATLQAAWDAGVRAFDTAPHYGAGLSEARVGRFLSARPAGDFVVSTKVGRLLVDPGAPGADPVAPEFAGEPAIARRRDYTGEGVRRSIEESLERLGLERIDVALVHDPEDHLEIALEEAFPALADMRAEGAIGAIGAGMNLVEPLERIVSEADVDCILLAGRYSLLDQSAGRSLLPLCAERGVSVLAAGVFNGEVLANPRPGAHYDYRPASDEIVARARAIGEICRSHGVALTAAAIAFPLRHPAVRAVVVGARTAEEARQDVAAFLSEVPGSLYEELIHLGLVTS